MKKLFFTFCFLLICFVSYSQVGTIKGFVYNRDNGEPVLFANIILENTTMGASTDDNGYFVINNVKPNTYNIKIQCLGYKDSTFAITVEKSSLINLKIELFPNIQQLDVVEVLGNKEASRTESQVSIQKITANDIYKIPSIGGQADIAQYLQVLPGVISSGDQGGQLYIRGGSAIQNKVLLDGMVVYNPFHSIGIFSVFETDIIRKADVYTGGFGAQYGGRLSSVIDISTKDGNKKRTEGKISFSTFAASALLEGPIIKDKEDRPYSLSYILTAKKSYLSQTSNSIYSYIDNDLPYDFFDLYGKISLTSKEGSKINLFGFNFTDDVKGYKNVADFNWKNMGVGTHFLLLPPGTSSLVEGTIAYSKYNMDMSATTNEGEQSSEISSFSGILSATSFYNKNQLKYGLEMIANKTASLFSSMDNEVVDNSTEMAAFVLFKGFLGNLLYEPSLRFSHYASLSESYIEPKLSLKYNVSKDFRLKAALGQYTQSFIDTKSDRDIVNLFTGYLTTGPDLYGGVVSSFQGKAIDHYVEKSNHFIFGAEWDIVRHLTLNAEIYYKTMSNLLAVNRDKLFDNNSLNSDLPEYQTKTFAVEKGTAYGGDISLLYSDGRFYFWAIYSYGKVERENEVQTYNPHYDRRHNINVLVSYQFGRDRSFELSARWNYGSGFPFTGTQGFVEYLPITSLDYDYTSANGNIHTLYGTLNGQRLPSYHRLDISAKKRFNIFAHSVLEIDASVTNVYDRNNIFYYDRVSSERVDQLPIMPSLAISLTF